MDIDPIDLIIAPLESPQCVDEFRIHVHSNTLIGWEVIREYIKTSSWTYGPLPLRLDIFLSLTPINLGVAPLDSARQDALDEPKNNCNLNIFR